jgi:hypothetical protein
MVQVMGCQSIGLPHERRREGDQTVGAVAVPRLDLGYGWPSGWP